MRSEGGKNFFLKAIESKERGRVWKEGAEKSLLLFVIASLMTDLFQENNTSVVGGG